MAKILNSLLASFAEAQDPAQDLDDLALDAEIEGRAVSVQAVRLMEDDPVQAQDGMNIRVEVARWTPGSPDDELSMLLTLHDMNARAFGLHPWRAHIDEEGMIHLSGVFSLEQPTALQRADLDLHISDGLQRAVALAGLLAQSEGSQPADTASLSSPASGPLNHGFA